MVDLYCLCLYAVMFAALFLLYFKPWARRPSFILFCCGNLILFFIAVGAVTKEILLSTSRSYDVSAKQQFDNVIIALTLGRGTVLYDRKAKHIIVIRESDITKIVPHGKKSGMDDLGD
jgi:hypothetical protein